MLIINKVFQILKSHIKALLIKLGLIYNKDDYYVSKIDEKAPWVYISYVAGVFYYKNDKSYMEAHQNRQETLCIVNVLNELGYNVYIQDYESRRRLPKLQNIKMVFGHEPNLVKAAEKYPEALVVQYNTGSYLDHANSQIIKMTDSVNEKYQSKLPYRRLINPKDRVHYEVYQLADRILQIGSKFTIATIPERFRNKIVTIHQSTQVNRSISIIDAPKNEFLFLGSTGNILKGIPLLVDYFTKHKEITLHLVGPIEEDYWSLIKEEITPNIVIHGFMDVNSDAFLDITSTCNFIIFPSGSEGCPGSVLCAMKYGMIPIVTPWAAFDEIEEYGYLMDYNWDVNSVAKGVEWALSLTPAERLQLKLKCKQYVDKYYTLERFSDEFRTFCINTLQS